MEGAVPVYQQGPGDLVGNPGIFAANAGVENPAENGKLDHIPRKPQVRRSRAQKVQNDPGLLAQEQAQTEAFVAANKAKKRQRAQMQYNPGTTPNTAPDLLFRDAWNPDQPLGLVRHTKPETPQQRARSQLAAQRKAIAQMHKRERAEVYDPALYGSIRLPIPRYTAAGQEFFGLTRESASDEQLANRDWWGFSGDGAYTRGGFNGSGAYTTSGGNVVMRPVGRFSGEGGFFDDIGNFIRNNVAPVAKNVVRAAAPIVGEALAPGIGGAVASGLAGKFLGEGEYTVDDNGEPIIKYNNLINHGSHQTKSTATIESAGDETGDLIFTHNEYIHDLTSKSNDFHTLERFEINPGVYQSFPLLSQFAQHFEEYDFIQCIFEFKSLVTDGNSTAAGSVMMAPNYNASNPNLPDKRSIENSTGSVSGKVTSSLFCGIECANDKTAYGGIKYVRTVDIDATGRRMYDLGFLQIAASGVPAGLAIGELWCRYKVRLSKMKVGSLKVVPFSGGLTLQMIAPNTDQIPDNAYFMNPTGNFVSKPSEPATVANGQLIAGDEFTYVSLAKEESDAAWTRVFKAEVGVIGASQYDVIVQYTNYHNVPSSPFDIYSATNIDNTTCTIPYNATHSVLHYTAAGAEMSTTTTWTHKFQIIFGTPGQIGKMNLQLNIPAMKPGNLQNDRVASCIITIRRSA